MASWQSKTKNRNKRWKVTLGYEYTRPDFDGLFRRKATREYLIKIPSKRYALAEAVRILFQSNPRLLTAEDFQFTHLSTHANHIQESKPTISITQRYDSVYGEGLDD